MYGITNNQRGSQGFTLLEVLIAVLILSIGLLGTAAMLVSAVRNNNTAYLRSQANFLTANMADRMMANNQPVWAGAFDGTDYNATTTISRACDATAPCTRAQLAARDAEQWGQMVGALLPNGNGAIACALTGARPSVTGSPAPNGPCTITVSWSEQTDKNVAGSVTQSFTLNFQP